MATEADDTRMLTLTRVINAPPALVWAAWTEARHVARWFAPRPYTLEVVELDLNVGGRWRWIMHGPEGERIHFGGTYIEIAPQERLVMTDRFFTPEGEPTTASHYGMSESFPEETTIAVTFAPAQGGTRITVEHSIPLDEARKSGAQEGWSQTLEQLSELVHELA